MVWLRNGQVTKDLLRHSPTLPKKLKQDKHALQVQDGTTFLKSSRVFSKIWLLRVAILAGRSLHWIVYSQA